MNFSREMSDRNVALSVSDANRYVKMLMDNDALLSSISVKGEISNLKYHTSGHLYFTLKDEESEISAVMFRSSVYSMDFSAKNGMKVTAYGRISVYEKSGKYQMYVSAMTDDGIGNLQIEYERLLKKLTQEGLFAQERKRKLPRFPSCIGIITSPTGAAVRDMINVTGRRWPMTKILLYPSLVQGDGAPEALCKGLECLNALELCDVIIIGRGGGSIEDLWAFNDENVVRAIANSKIPVISAVGHETDFTLCDFAADCRAPTPSAAAELAVPDKTELKVRVDDSFSSLESAFMHFFRVKKSQTDNLSKRLRLASPITRLENEKKAIALKCRLLDRLMLEKLRSDNDRLRIAVGKLEAMNPLSVLSRGFSVAKREDGSLISSVENVSVGDKIKLVLSDGEAGAQILHTTKR